jgi:hypothetical protein
MVSPFPPIRVLPGEQYHLRGARYCVIGWKVAHMSSLTSASHIHFGGYFREVTAFGRMFNQWFAPNSSECTWKETGTILTSLTL